MKDPAIRSLDSTDAGFNDETLERIGGALPNGTSSLAVTTSKDFIEAVRDANSDQDTMTLAQQIADGISGSLEAGQDTLVALMLSEAGVAATKVVSSPEAIAVFGIGATAEGVAAGAVVATDEGIAAAEMTAVPLDDDSDAADASDDSEGDSDNA